jgi:hypothetical protein
MSSNKKSDEYLTASKNSINSFWEHSVSIYKTIVFSLGV